MCDLTLEKHTMQVVSPPMDDSGALWRPVILPASLSARTDEAVFPSAQEMPIVGSTSGDGGASFDSPMHASAGVCPLVRRSFFFFEDLLFGFGDVALSSSSANSASAFSFALVSSQMCASSCPFL